MLILRNLKKDDVASVLQWNENSKDFLNQWSNFTYPLTRNQYQERIESDDFRVFAIEYDNVLVGTIQIFKFKNGNNEGRIGCYLVDPKMRNRGIGSRALKETVQYAFEELNLNRVTLGVWKYNENAIKCYENAGFVKYNEYENEDGLSGFEMEFVKGEED